MGKISEETMLAFITEFASEVQRIDKTMLEDALLIWDGARIALEDAVGETAETVKDYVLKTDDRVTNYVYDFIEGCVGYLVCEGGIYTKVYWFWAEGIDPDGHGNDAEMIYNALEKCTEKYGMWYDYADGAFYLFAR